MLQPTPLLRPSPMDLSGIFSGTFAILKKRWGLMIGIAAMPIVAVFLAAVVVITLVFFAAFALFQGAFGLPFVVVAILAIVALIVAVPLINYKGMAMVIQASYETSQGLEPSFGGVWSNTKGVMPRSIPYYLLMIGLSLAILVPFGLFLVLIWVPVNLHDSHAVAMAAVATLLVFVLLPLVLMPLVLWIRIKLLYVMAAITIEAAGGMAAVKRSWGLTKGAFWRTFGYYLVGSLVVGAISGVVSMFSRMLLLPLNLRLQSLDNQQQAAAAFSVALPLLILVFVIQLAVSLLTTPALWTYITCMYLDQVRREGLPPVSSAPGYGYPPNQYAPNQYPQSAPGNYPPPPPSGPIYPVPTTIPGVDDSGAEPMEPPKQ
jgi:hypothetical protein